MKLLKNKIFLVLMLCLTVLAGAFYFVSPTQKVSADNDYELIVQKVDLQTNKDGKLIDINGNETTNNTKFVEREIVDDYTPQDLKTNNVAMLLNSYPITNGGAYYRQYIKVSFLPAESLNMTLQFLEVNATLNGIAIDTKEVTGETSSSNHSYTQYFDLTDIKLLKDGSVVDKAEAQGLFEFTFGYMSKAEDGTTNPKNTVKVSFYALDENSYINKDDSKSILEPKLANAEEISRDIVGKQTTLSEAEKKHPNIYSFFNYNNAKTVDYFGNANKLDKIYYPTITYDPTKYYVSFSKLLYGETETTTSLYDPTNQKVILTSTSNGITTTKTYDVIIQDIMIKDEIDNYLYDYTNYYVKIPLYDIGSYHIAFDFVVKQYNTNNYEQLVTRTLSDGIIDKTKMEPVTKENWYRMGDIELNIYGYQLYHTVYKDTNGASENELTDHSTIFADVTNANLTTLNGFKVAGIPFDVENFSNDTVATLNKYDSLPIITTNQAPLMFRYNGSIVSSGTTTYSYYNRYTDINKNFAVVDGVKQSKIQIDSNTKFTENGYYEVYVVYNYNGYEYILNGSLTKGNKFVKIQTFAFVIENIDPELTLKAVDEKGVESEFSANGFTNKDIKMTWDVSNPFNVLPELYISTKSFNSSQIIDVTSTYQSQIENGQVLLAESNLYIITIYYGPCTYNAETKKYDYSASVDYEFTIDKEPITEFTVRDVYNGEDSNSNWNYFIGNEINTTSVNKNFIVTFGEQSSEFLRNGRKSSSATITVTYDHYLFDTNSDAYQILEAENKLYLQNGYEVSSINKNLNYSQITKVVQTGETRFLISDKNEYNAIITENGLYVFNLQDQAGNTASFAIILDKTKPVMFKNNRDLLKGENNIVSTDTQVIWGDYKIIDLTGVDEDIIKKLNTDKANIVKLDNVNYYFSKILNTNIKIDGENETALNSTSTTFYTKDDTKQFYDEHVYSINVFDELGNTNDLTYLEMNFDKSLLKAHISGNAINNIQVISNESYFESEQVKGENTDLQRIYNGTATNRQKLFIDWLANDGTEYAIKNVICEFYPLTFEDGGINYPYSTTATQTFDLSTNKSYDTIDGEERVKSVFINLVQDDRYGEKATMPGMYKIIRTYSASALPVGSLDVLQREYIFYIDRQNIISYFNNNILIGSEIGLDMQNGAKTFKGAQFLQEFIEEYVLITNKLPVKAIVPSEKYSSNNVIPLEESVVSQIGLNYIVKDNSGFTVYDSTDKTKTNLYLADETYTVTIYDSTNGKYENANLDGTNKLIFKFNIKKDPPQVSIVNKDNIIVTDDAFNYNKVKIVWNEDLNGYMANIDTRNLEVTKVLPSGIREVIYKKVNGVYEKGQVYGDIIIKANDNVSWNYEVDLSKFNISRDCKLEITVQYEGNEADYGNSFKTTQTIYFDYTAPQYNFNNLLSQDQFLTQTEKQNFEDVNSAINYENYAFTIDENFKISYSPADSFWKNLNGNNANELYSAWYRKYDKYADNNNAETMQSIVPTDSRYSDLAQAPQRLRFNENLTYDNDLKYYHPISNPDLTLYEIVHGQPGYYEIIEMDIAGNYRVYTVAIYPQDSYKNDFIFGYNNNMEAKWLINEDNYSYNINGENIEVTNINSFLQTCTVGNNWFNVYLTSTKNSDNQTATYRTSPIEINGMVTIDELIEQINEFIYYEELNAGYSFGIVLTLSNGKTFTINYRTPGEAFELNFEGSQANLTVSFTQDPTSSVYLTEFYVYEAVNGEVEIDNENYLKLDSDNKTIVTNPEAPNALEEAKTISYTFRSGTGINLVFVYVDNFGVENRIFKIIGITDVDYEDMIVIDGEYDKNTKTENDKYYYEYFTNQIVKLNYQPAIYNITSIVKTDENLIEEEIIVADLSSDLLANGTTLLNLFNERAINSYFKIEIELTDTLGGTYKFVVHYYSKLADLIFIDSSNNTYDNINGSVISRTLYLTFDKNQYQPYESTVVITKSYTDEYGEYFEETFTAETGIMLTEGANYIIQISNRFGDSYIYNFTIRKSSATHFYSVLVRPDGINLQEIVPSKVKYSYNGLNIDQYFTIYEAIVEVSSKDNLVCEEKEKVQHTAESYTTVYHIHSDDESNMTYEKYIAVTKVTYTRDLLTNKFGINETVVVNQKQSTVTDETVTITMPAYYDAIGNQIQVQIYYNSAYIGYLKEYTLSADGTTISFNLYDSGTYMLYVSDLAGNTQWFKDSKYFTLYVLNNVVYKLNGEYGISNSVFNTSVELSFDETQTLFTRQEVTGSSYKQYIAITSTLNGRSYTPSRNGDKYVYSQYGTYIINLSGIVNNDTENPIVTTVKFSIINENEAKVAHEYIGLNGYEITNIVKNGIDITDEIRTKLNMLTLNSFAISGGINSVGGNGHYDITVKVTHTGITPTQYFTYKVWINNDTDALILCSIKEGESTTKSIEIQLNLYQIYSKLGECVVKINGSRYITINEQTGLVNRVSTYKLTQNQRYNITLETNSGNTISSFVVTKVEPLNTIAIIVIVVACVVVIGLTVTFILLRKKMKVR